MSKNGQHEAKLWTFNLLHKVTAYFKPYYVYISDIMSAYSDDTKVYLPQ